MKRPAFWIMATLAVGGLLGWLVTSGRKPPAQEKSAADGD
jgi:hypothetical protein